MAETKNLTVTSLQMDGSKVYIKIGDHDTKKGSDNSGAIQFLGDIKTEFDRPLSKGDNLSQFRIRHDSIERDLIIQSNNDEGETRQLLRFSDDGYIFFDGTVTFQDIVFDEITGSALYIGSGSTFGGTISVPAISNLQYINGITASSFGGGSSWKSVQMITSSLFHDVEYPIYTSSNTQIITDPSALSVYLNGNLLLKEADEVDDGEYTFDGVLGAYKIIFRYNIPYSLSNRIYLTYIYNGGT